MSKRVCADCGKKLTKKDYESKMVLTSDWSGRRWCPKCVYRMIRR